MSEFIAEAQVLVVPNTKAFRAQLQAQLITATRGMTVPVGITASGRAGAQVAGALSQIDKSGKNATASLLGAATASAKLDAALLGLRTALGSTAVIGLGAVALGAIVVGKAIRASIVNFAAFEAELNTFEAVAEATASQMEAVREQATALGADIRLPAVSAADAAVAMTELAKAGLTVEEALAGAEGVLQLATAAQISNAEAALITANALNSFGLEGEQAVEVADALANAANAAQGSISDFGLALRQSSAVARQVGLSLQDTTAILSLFAKNGLQGSDAGTSLRVALIKLVAPTKAARAEIEKLNLDLRDAQGNFRADIFAQFGEATRNLTPALRDASAALIFGQDAIRAVSIGAREGTLGLKLMQFEIDQQGTAAEVASARTEGLGGAFSALASSAQTTSVLLGKLASPVLTAVIGGFSDLLTIINNAPGAFDRLNQKLEEEIPLLERISDGFSFLGGVAAQQARDSLEALEQPLKDVGLLSAEQSEELKALNDDLQAFQTARIAALKGGQAGIADQLTKEINALKDEIKALKDEGAGISQSITAPLQKALDLLRERRDVRLEIGADTTQLDRMIASLEKSIPITQHVEGNMARLRDDFGGLANSARDGAGGVDALTAALARLRTQSAAASDELLRAQNEGAGPQAQIAILQGQRQTQEDIIANLRRDGIGPGDPTAIRAARNEINRIQGQIDSLQAGIVSDANAAASAAERAAKDAQDARDKQFQALADLFGGRQEDIENQFERAGIRGNIEKQIRLNKALIAALQKELKVLRERLRNVKVSAEVRKRIMEAITDALEEARQDALRLQQEQLDAAKAFATPAIDLRIRIAQARDNVAAEIALRRQRLTLLTKELVRLKNAGKKNTLAWLELKVQQAEEIAAINDLAKQQEDKGKSAQEFFFEQLQAQQGFAANLLGNLITGPTEGLVGVPAAPTPQRGAAQQAQVAQGRSQIGPTAGQAQTTNDILTRILGQLKELNGDQKNPEASRQRRSQNSVMDYQNTGGGYGF